MNNNTLLLVLFLLLSSCATETADTPRTPPTATEMTEQLRHVVLFKFKEEATSADIQKIEAAFAALPAQIEEIKDFEWGLNNSPEELNKGFTHCFTVTFASEEGRAVYLPHPAHQAFVEELSPHLEDVLVVDYWAK